MMSAFPQEGKDLIAIRDTQMGSNVSVFYKDKGGLVAVRGEGCYLIDQAGGRHLDTCNNVACVGHSHPAVVRAGQEALGMIQTNQRFLHPGQQRYLAKLLLTFPPELDTVYLCNSGSEANDLALRMAREHTKLTAKNPRDVIVLDSGYHGNTTATMELSPYKWCQKASANTTIAPLHGTSDDTQTDRDTDTDTGTGTGTESSTSADVKGGKEKGETGTGTGEEEEEEEARERERAREHQPAHVHVVSMPDVYRGVYSRAKGYTPAQAAALYAEEVAAIVTEDSTASTSSSEEEGRSGRSGRRSTDGRARLGIGGCGTFIAESAMGCGGQVVLPPTYLERCYALVRAAGGVCIADEVQTGFGRNGDHFWMFQQHDVVPDIVTLGKPMGNGYPLSAVVCRRSIADSFSATGIEYFNTFGGNSVACAIGEAVLDTIREENLQENARLTGKYLSEQLKSMQCRFACLGDVRGCGLFQGIEFIKTQELYRKSEVAGSGSGSDEGNGEEQAEPDEATAQRVVDFLQSINIISSRGREVVRQWSHLHYAAG